MLVWDMTDLDDPVLITEHLGPTAAIDHNMYVKGHFVYHSNYHFGLRVVDVSNPASPIEAGFFINIDPVEDIVDGVPSGTFFDPVLTTGGELGSCTDSEPDGLCDAAPTLTALGEKVEDLDIAGTTVQEILDAADSLITSGNADITVNAVLLTRDDVTDILGLINESYDEGDPTGFVTAFDAD